MVVYAVTFVFVAVILVASYRALGTGTSSDADVDLFVINVGVWVQADAARLEFLAEADALTDADVETARDVRKKVAGYQQQLNRLVAADGERSPLSLSIEALGWACRMVETGGYAVNPGVRAAAKALFEYANRQLAGSEVGNRVSDPVVQVPAR